MGFYPGQCASKHGAVVRRAECWVLGVDTQNIFTQAGGHLARPGRPAEMFYAVMDFAISCGGQRSNLPLLPAKYVVLFLYDVRIL